MLLQTFCCFCIDSVCHYFFYCSFCSFCLCCCCFMYRVEKLFVWQRLMRNSCNNRNDQRRRFLKFARIKEKKNNHTSVIYHWIPGTYRDSIQANNSSNKNLDIFWVVRKQKKKKKRYDTKRVDNACLTKCLWWTDNWKDGHLNVSVVRNLSAYRILVSLNDSLNKQRIYSKRCLRIKKKSCCEMNFQMTYTKI